MGTPYIVREMGYADFNDMKHLHDVYIGHSKQLFKDTKMGDIKILRMEKTKPSTLMYKTSFADEVYKETNVVKPNLRTTKSSNNNQDFQLQPAFSEKLPLSDKKEIRSFEFNSKQKNADILF
ncbi:hypothetical protein NQ314_011986 [Rhamnusium bicolor]|uniref:Uncharacterized protein n=1 Tax=Rhamnusium bicolor TaxID=1586634 RepID=A0AAV8XE11_9CUCU|nr:hypothetical protein NQ314_011986 [Rhamnusium bicolor]